MGILLLLAFQVTDRCIFLQSRSELLRPRRRDTSYILYLDACSINHTPSTDKYQQCTSLRHWIDFHFENNPIIHHSHVSLVYTTRYYTYLGISNKPGQDHKDIPSTSHTYCEYPGNLRHTPSRVERTTSIFSQRSERSRQIPISSVTGPSSWYPIHINLSHQARHPDIFPQTTTILPGRA